MGPCAVERVRTEETKVVRSRLTWWPCLPAGAILKSGSMVLPQLGSVLTSMASAAMDACGLGYYL